MYAERQKARNGGHELSISQQRILEIYIPTVSVSALLGVTGYILSDAIRVLREGDDGEEVNVYFLFGFAGANFIVDIISSFMFYWKGKEVLISGPMSMERRQSILASEDSKLIPNLNMISALTHVGSDTLRTIAVFVAAIVSTAGNVIASICDAWAAVVITITICFAVMPLLTEIYNAHHRINNPNKNHFSEETLTPL